MPKINIPQKKLTLDVVAGTNLMNALLDAGLPVASSCHGDGICSMCRVMVDGSLPAPLSLESDCLKRNKCSDQERLSCQIEVNSNLSVKAKYW